MENNAKLKTICKSIAKIVAVIIAIIALQFGISRIVFQQKDTDTAISFNEYRIAQSEIVLSTEEYTGEGVTVSLEIATNHFSETQSASDVMNQADLVIEYKLDGDSEWTRYVSPIEITKRTNITARFSTSDNSFKGPETIKPVQNLAVAKIGNVYYELLADAIDACPQNAGNTQTKIEMIANTTESVTIPAGKNIILDLCGATVTSNETAVQGSDKPVSPNTITVNGKLNLIDSAVSENPNISGNGALVSTTGASVKINNGGVFTLGTNEANEPQVSIENPVINGGNYGIIVEQGGEFNFYDGIISGTTSAITKDNGEPKVTDKPENYVVITYEQSAKEFAILKRQNTVSFNSNGGTPSEIESIKVIEGKAYNTYGTWPQDPTRNGYTFGGWGLDENIISDETIVTQTQDHTLTAIWTPITYNITYDYSNGALPQGVTNPGTYNIETETFTLNNPSKTGYTFQGWQEANSQTANNPETITIGSYGDRSYTAVFVDDIDPNKEPPTGEPTTSTIKVTFNQTDSGSGINPATIEYGIKINDQWVWESATNGEQEGTHTFTGLNSSTTYEIKTRAKDNAGNNVNGPVESNSANVTTLDITLGNVKARKNTVEGDNIVLLEETNENATRINTDMNVEVIPGPVGTTTAVIKGPDGALVPVASIITNSTQGNRNQTIETQTGVYQIILSTVDDTNENNAVTKTYYVYFDRDNPTISSTNTTTTNSITINANAADVGAGVDTVTYRLVQGSIDQTIITGGNSGTAYTSDVNFTGLAHNTDCQVTITVTDKAGNITTSTQTIKTNELIPADLTFKKAQSNISFTPSNTQIEDDVWINEDANITLVENNAQATSTYTVKKVEDANGTTYNSNATIETTNGEYVATVTTTDGTNSVSKEYYFHVDKTAPSVSTYAGKMIFTDPQFVEGNNGLQIYDPNETGNVAITREQITDDNSSSGYGLQITSTGAENQNCGGITLSGNNEINKEYIIVLKAKIPEGYNLNFTTGNIDESNGGAQEWLTQNIGTGKWETYAYRVKTGSTNVEQATKNFYISGTQTPTQENPLNWYIDYATIFETTQTTDSKYIITIATDNESGVTDYAQNNDNTITPTFETFDSTVKIVKISNEITQNGTQYSYAKDKAGNQTTVTTNINDLGYTITYNANGGQGTIEPQIKIKGTQTTLNDGSNFTYTNHILAGWAESDIATVPEYAKGGVFNEDRNLTLYAVWDEVVATTTIRVYEDVEGVPTLTSETTTPYTSIQSAIDAVGANVSNGTEAIVTLIKDNVRENVTIANGQNITLNMNQKQWSNKRNTNDENNPDTLTNYGIVTITGQGKIIGNNNSNAISNATSGATSGNTTIINTEVNADNTAINVGEGTLTLGDVTDTTEVEGQTVLSVSTEIPAITGNQIGINNSNPNATFNFYDGIITSAVTKTILTDPTAVPEHYVVEIEIRNEGTEDEIEVAYLVDEATKIKYEITAEVSGGNGTVKSNGEAFETELIPRGHDQENIITFVPNSGYRVQSIWLYSGEEVDGDYDETDGTEIELYSEDAISAIVTVPMLTNLSENKHYVVKFEERPLVAQVVYVPAGQEDTLNANNELILNHTYYSLTEALADTALLDTSIERAEIKIIADIKNEASTIQVNNNVTLDLNGHTITSRNGEPTITINAATLNLVNKDSENIGSVINKDGIGIKITTQGTLDLGTYDDTVSIFAPYVEGTTIGILNDKNLATQEEGTFNFYDGKIAGSLSTSGTITSTPLRPVYYEPNTQTVSGKQVTVLGIDNTKEAAIGRKTYQYLEDAIREAGTVYGTDGSQVEIVLLKDITKSSTVLVDETKNIKLDLNGKIFTTSSANYVLENKGDLEICDSTATASNHYGTGKITNSKYGTIKNSSYDGGCGNLVLTSGEIEVNKSGQWYDLTKGILNNGNLQIGNQGVNDIYPYLYSVNSYTNVVENTSNLVMYNGLINTASVSDGRGILSSGNAQINGGQINCYYESFAVASNTPSTVTNVINGGTFNKTINNYSTRNLTINNGTFSGVITTNNTNQSTPPTITINNGTFNSTINPKNYARIIIEDGVYNGQIKPEDSSSVTINNGTFKNRLYMSSSGKVTINNGNFTFTGSDSLIYAWSGTLDINNATITSTNKTIEDYYGVVNIYNGEIKSTNSNTIYLQYNESAVNIYGGTIRTESTYATIYSNKNGTVTMGVKNDNDVSIVTPQVIGLNGYGVYGETMLFNFYDGIIKSAPNKTIYGPIKEVQEGTMLDISYEGNNNSVEVAKLLPPSDPIAQIGETTYTTLESAINAVPENNEKTTIKILKNINMVKEESISANKNIALDLNGKDIKVYKNKNVIENNGTLEIVDNSKIPETSIGFEGKVDSTYGFDIVDNKLVSTNKNRGSTTANTYIPIDLTEYSGTNISINVNATISSEANWDFGYATVTTNTTVPAYDNTEGRFMYLSGQKSNVTNSISVVGGKVYYLHFGYRKDGGTDSYSDTFTINSINYSGADATIKGKFENLFVNKGNLKLKAGVIDVQLAGDYNSTKNAIVNTGAIEVDGTKIKFSGTDYINIISNTGAGSVVVNSGEMGGSYITSIKSTGSGGVLINGGTFSGPAINNTSPSNVTITDGRFLTNGISDSTILNKNGTLTISGGYFETNDYRNVIGSNGGIVNINGGTISATALQATGIYLSNGADLTIETTTLTANGIGINISNSTSKALIKDGTYNATASYYMISSYGTATIQGGTYTSSRYGFRNYSSGNMTISNVSVTSGSYTALYNYGTANVLSGSFTQTGTSDGAITNTGTLNLGTKDGVVDDQNPYVSGGSIGVKNSGTFNFYDGIIYGATDKAISGSVTSQEENFETIKENITGNKQKAYLGQTAFVVRTLTGKTYRTLQEAINECEDNNENEVIQILRDTIISGSTAPATVPSTKKIKLDLNGYECIIGNKDTIINQGNLEVIDSSTGKTGILRNTTYTLFVNEGTGNLTFNNVKLTASASTYTENNNTVSAYVVNNTGTGTVTISDSTLIAGNTLINNSSTGTITISNGDLRGGDNAIINAGAGTINITGSPYIYGTRDAIENNSTGTITVNMSSTGEIYGYSRGITNGNGNVEVYGGTVHGVCGITNENSGTGNIDIYGGTIDAQSRYGWGDINGYAIYITNGNLTIHDGTIAGSYSIGITGNTNAEIITGTIQEYIRINNSASEMVINDGTFSSNIYNSGILEIIDGTYSGNIINYSTGNATISGGDFNITSQSNYAIENAGTVVIEDATVTTTSTNGMYNSGTLTVEKLVLNVTGTNSKAVFNTGTLTFGENDGTIDSSNISITANAYGIDTHGTNGIFNFYDGSITANTTLQGEITNIATNSRIQVNSNGNTNTATLEPLYNIVEIAGQGYTSLQSAIDDVPDNGATPTTIQVITDFIATTSDLATISQNKNVILDLNGHTISNFGKLLNNNGQLKIINSVADSSSITGFAKNLLSNTGTLEIATNITQNRNNVMFNNTNGGTIVISSGTILANNDDSYYTNTVINNNGSGTIQVTGGYISLNRNRDNAYFIYTDNSSSSNLANITISSGTITGANSYGIYSARNANINISGGTITDYRTIYGINSNINITGGEIISSFSDSATSEFSAVYNGSGRVNMSGGQIRANGYCGIISSGGQVNITNGSVESTSTRGIQISNSASLTLGDGVYPVNTSYPTVSGGTYGVVLGNYDTFNFYDGTINGGTKAHSGNITNVPETHKVEYSNDEKTATLGVKGTFHGVVKIVGGSSYDSLQEAINSVTDGNPTTIQVQSDMLLDNVITVPSGKIITLDLNLYAVRSATSDATITNNGNLTIIDSTEDGSNTQGYAVVQNYVGNAIQNNGTLTIGVNDGNVYTNSPRIIASEATAVVNDSGATFNQYDGTLVDSNGNVSAQANSVSPQSVNKSSIKSIGLKGLRLQTTDVEGNNSNTGNDSNTRNEVNTETESNTGIENNTGNEGNTKNDSSVNKTKENNASNNESSEKLNEETKAESDGEIEETNKTDGTEAEKTEENETKEETQIAKNLKIGENYYETLEEAIASSEVGNTIQVLEDISITQQLNIDKTKDIKLDLNGKTISLLTENAINNNGKLVITNTGIIKQSTENTSGIVNTGTLEVQGGIITSVSQNSKIIYNKGGNVKINGGKVIAETQGSTAIYNDVSSNLEILGGIIETREKSSKAIYNNGNLVIGKQSNTSTTEKNIKDNTSVSPKIVVAKEDSTAIYNSKSAKKCLINTINLIVEAEQIPNYELIKNTNEFKTELKNMKTSYGIVNDATTDVTIKSGVIRIEKIKSVGIRNTSTGNIIIGNKDDNNVNTSLPVIYAIEDNTKPFENKSNGNICFYDGRICSIESVKSLISKVLNAYNVLEDAGEKIITTTLAK